MCSNYIVCKKIFQLKTWKNLKCNLTKKMTKTKQWKKKLCIFNEVSLIIENLNSFGRT